MRDAGYLYGERPCVGHLATAAFQMGGASLEEFAMGRQPPNSKLFTGWGDLWIQALDHKVLIEAKWIDFHHKTKPSVLSKRLNDKLDETAKVNEFETVDVTYRWGVLLAVCTLNKDDVTAAGGVTDNLINDIWESVLRCRNDRWDHVAFYVSRYPNEIMMNGRYYPGVIMIIREYEKLLR